MKFYKVINNKRLGSAPFVMTEKAYEIAEKSKNIIKNLHLIGECDANGNLLTDISASNFSSKGPAAAPQKPAEKKEPVKEIDPLTIDSDDGPELIDFNKETLKEKTDEQEKITGGTTSGSPTTGTDIAGPASPSDKSGGAKKLGGKAKKKA